MNSDNREYTVDELKKLTLKFMKELTKKRDYKGRSKVMKKTDYIEYIITQQDFARRVREQQELKKQEETKKEQEEIEKREKIKQEIEISVEVIRPTTRKKPTKKGKWGKSPKRKRFVPPVLTLPSSKVQFQQKVRCLETRRESPETITLLKLLQSKSEVEDILNCVQYTPRSFTSIRNSPNTEQTIKNN